MPVWYTKPLAQSLAQDKLGMVVVQACDPGKHRQEDGMFKAIFNCMASLRPLTYTRHCLQEKRRKGKEQEEERRGAEGR